MVGFGNIDRRDDGAGHRVVEGIGTPDCVAAGDGAVELVEDFASHDRVILIDAVKSGAPPGTIHRFDEGQAYPRAWGGSSHSMGLVEILELAKALDTLPPDVSVIGVEVGDTSEGLGLSAPVEHAVAVLVEELSNA